MIGFVLRYLRGRCAAPCPRQQCRGSGRCTLRAEHDGEHRHPAGFDWHWFA